MLKTINTEIYNKAANSTLSHEEWNTVAESVATLVENASNTNNNPSEQPSVGSSEYITLSSKGNVEISSPKHINIEPAQQTYENGEWSGNAGDIQLKPGDDISLYSSHRGEKTDEVSVKVLDGSDHPVKLQIQAGEITLQAKQRNLTKAKEDVTGVESENEYQYDDDQANVFDINVTTEYKPNRGTGSKKSGKGYLKVRAQAIDLRCEDNGGIALQPKGNDGNGHENKIKFEHNGGDGLEFGTFNTKHTSIFTNDYRFNKDGIVYAATRQTPVEIHEDPNDPNSPVKKIDYPTQADDFKDVIDESKGATWGAIVNTANALNNDQIETRIADYESIGKRGLLISGRKCVRVISNSRSEIQALIDNNDPSVDQVSISTDGTTTAEILSDTDFPFTGTFPVGEILDIEKLKYTAGRYTGLESYLYELSLGGNGYKKIIYFANSQDVALFLEVVVYDITFATEQPFILNLHYPDTDPLWPEHSVSVSDLIKLVEWFKKPANISNMGSVNPFNVQSNP